MDSKPLLSNRETDMDRDIENTETDKVLINWVGVDGRNRSRVVPSEWVREYVRAIRKMSNNPDSVSYQEVF